MNAYMQRSELPLTKIYLINFWEQLQLPKHRTTAQSQKSPTSLNNLKMIVDKQKIQQKKKG